MYWSYSGSKVFRRCPRRWYFENSVANFHPKAKNPIRREAFLLSQLQTLDALRGDVVDKVIEKYIVLPLSNGGSISRNRVMVYAEQLFDSKMNFAYRRRSREPGMVKDDAGNEYAALFEIEYEQELLDEDIERARHDIVTSLNNLLNNNEILGLLRSGDQLLAQRSLFLHEEDFTVKAIPDVVVLFEDKPPLIMDWKVNVSSRYDHWLQLACYAITLTRGDPHKDFRILPNLYEPTKVQLAEVQLLTNDIRWYQLSEEDVDLVEAHILATGTDMVLALGDESNASLRPFEFDTTHHPDDCLYCPFQKICGDDELWAS